jgi:hypothetical protein
MAEIYLAGPAAEYERVIAHAADLEKLGHTFTQPWWERVVEERKRGWMNDREVPAGFMTENAVMNRLGLDRAEFVIALCRLRGGVSAGCGGEVAYGVALHHAERIERDRNTVIMVGDPQGFVWSFDPCVKVVPTMTDAIAFLPSLPRRLS